MKNSFRVFVLTCLCINAVVAQQISGLARVDSLIESTDYASARNRLEELISKSSGETTAVLENRLAETLVLQGKLDEAEQQLKKINTTSPFTEAITKTNLGFLFINKARNDLALDNLKQAQTLFQQSGNANTPEATKCLSHLSFLFMSQGKHKQAEENGLMALQMRQALRGEDSPEVAASYNDLGLVYSQLDADKALTYYEKALAFYQKNTSAVNPKIAIASTNIGRLYQSQKLYGDAITNFETAEGIWKKIYPDGHPNQALTLLNLGETYGEMGNKKTALEYFDKALTVYKKSYGTKHPDISQVLNRMGLIKLEENKYDEALASFQEAICANTLQFNDKSISKNPPYTDYYNGKVLLYSMEYKAQALESKYFGKTLKLTDLTSALTCLQICDSLVDDIRYHSTDESDKLALGASANEVYEHGVRVSIAISEVTLKNRPFLETAFYFAEKSKSAVLQESIADTEAKSFAGIPDNLLAEEKDLKASIALRVQQLSQKPGPSQENELRKLIFELNGRYENFIKQLEKNYPDYFNLKFNQAAPSIRQIQDLLDEKTAVISYLVAEQDLKLYSFIITKSKFSVYNSTLPKDFDRSIKGFNNSLYYSVTDSYREASNALSKLLLRGVPSSAKNLVIIPSGRLSTMPFEALSVKKLSSATSTPNFLVEKYAIGYEFSAGLLLQKNKSGEGWPSQSIFLCAPVSFPTKDNLAELPGTESEVRNISQLFKSNTLTALRNDANEGLIKSGKLADYRYLHFATHGIVDEESPELSRIFLQPAAKEDGNVFSGELFNIKLHAELAVLSACQTGLGKFSKGEGIIGLSRALVYAGAKNILVSYWSVADESTSQLMTAFYQELLTQSKPDFRTALQKAKTEMIKSSRYKSPYYWAPFVLIGF